jgi:hypothetical protein
MSVNLDRGLERGEGLVPHKGILLHPLSHWARRLIILLLRNTSVLRPICRTLRAKDVQNVSSCFNWSPTYIVQCHWGPIL